MVRVRPASELAVAEREVAVARALAEAGVPAVRLIEPGEQAEPSPSTGLGQPWRIGGWAATAWAWVTGAGTPNAAELGAMCRTLGERTRGIDHGVPLFDPLAAVLNAVAHLPADDDEALFVRQRTEELRAPWHRAADRDPAGRCIVHGDLHSDNVLVGPDGPLLVDLELAGVGPASFDVAPSVVAVDRYGADPESLGEFLAAYEGDPRAWDGFATCVDVYELWVTAWAVGVRGVSEAAAAEASRRVRCLRDQTCEPWRLS